MKRILAVLISIVICAGAMVSCGDGDKKTEVNGKKYTQDKADEILEAVNSDAKKVYDIINGILSDKIADGRINQFSNTEYMFTTRSPGNDQFSKEVASAIKDADILGEVYFKIDSYKLQFVQLRYTEDGIVGQYPDPINDVSEEIKFGKRYDPDNKSGDSSNSANSETDSKKDPSGSSDSSNDDNSSSEKDTHYDYYKDLAAAFKSSPAYKDYENSYNDFITQCQTFGWNMHNYAELSDNEKNIIFQTRKDDETTINVYNIDSKKIVATIKPNKNYDTYLYKKGYIYLINDYYTNFHNVYYIEKYDEQGNNTVLKPNEKWNLLDKPYVFDNNKILSKVGEPDSREEYYMVFDPDLQNGVKIPEIEVEASHGLKEKVVPSKYHITSNGVFGYANDELYYFDADKLVWEKTAKLEHKLGYYPSWFKFGKYLMTINRNRISYSTNFELYDLSTGELIANQGGRDYYGDEFNYELLNVDGKIGWYKVQYPDKSGTEKKKEFVSAEGEDSDVNFIMLNNKYYLAVDDYGVFLRTYEKGSSSEETVMLFDKKDIIS